MKNPQFVVFDKRESFMASMGKDLVTFSGLLLCLYVSRGSAWWTFLTGLMATLELARRAITSDRKKSFHGKAELQAWVDSIQE